MTIKEVARAKVNLCLHVTGQRADGYHLLDSIVAFADFGDVLTFDPADSVSLSIGGPFADGLSGAADNLILQAARSFSGTRGARIHLEKNLPVASGIGGGSADAAAALRGLAALWDCPLPDAAAQLALGADVPVCVAGQAVRMQGIGEQILPLNDWTEMPVVLVNPGASVSTPSVFKALNTKQNPSILDQPRADLDWLAQQRNDLQAPAIAQEPVIADVLARLDRQGAGLVRMSGSGATCFGIFATDEAAAQAGVAIARDNPDWWIQTTRLTT